MNEKGKQNRNVRWLFAIRRYITFFLLMAFVISCCMTLFLNMMTRSTGLSFTKEHIEQAAKVTFLNVIGLSLLCTVIDGIRRKFMVDQPVQKIVKAAEQIMKGDFSVRIPPFHTFGYTNGFDVVADYLNQMAKELSGTETLRTDFIANVSHELKTPLAVIQNYGTMLQQPNLTEEKRMEYARAITDASRRLANLITNILKLNKLENQQIYPSVKTYDLGEQLCECLLSFEGAWEAKDLEITKPYDAKEGEKYILWLKDSDENIDVQILTAYETEIKIVEEQQKTEQIVTALPVTYDDTTVLFIALGAVVIAMIAVIAFKKLNKKNRE